MTDAEISFHDIAVVGMVCRLPGAANVDRYWQNLARGVESITFLSEEELIAAGVSRAQIDDPSYVRSVGGWLDDIDLFDAAFFGMSPREAEITDPQQRLFLESCHEALENAGYDPETYDGLIGVFAGGGIPAYAFEIVHSRHDLVESVGVVGTLIGSASDYLPTRVSYALNLKGPSVNVQTACSTGLVATHIACRSLLTGDCNLAIAGGTSITTIHKSGYLYEEGGIYSPDGHCRAFDARADGIVGGNGIAIVVLKRLQEALEDGDTIHAVIKGSAINNDGSARVGFTAPGIDGQSQVIADAIAMADIDPRTISYVEAHGTGTSLGDPIEVAALTRAFRASTGERGFCGLGSVKTNIGHTNAASGVAGLIKTILCLEHRELVPTLHFERPNPKLELEESPFFVITDRRPWRADGFPLRAGVSSFGIGGTNAHVIVEAAPASPPAGSSRGVHLLLLSARTAAALDKATANLAAHLRAHPDLDMSDVAFTMQVGRRAFPHRRFAVVRGTEDAVDVLEADAKRVLTATTVDKANVPVVFMFPGQGAQYVDMGRELYEAEPVFKEQVDACAELLRPHLGLDLRDVLYPDAADAARAEAQLGQTAIAQPALFVVEYALARLWQALGVRAEAMIGHSVGEYVAACLAGVFSLGDALALLAARGRMTQALSEGCMLSVGLSEKDVEPWLGSELALAAVNGPSACVLSGPADAITGVQQRLEGEGTPCRLLQTSHAFHSAMMDPIVEPFAALVRDVELSAARIPCVSTVSGTWIDPSDWADPDYWVRHLRETVRFSQAARALLAEPESILLEVGPGRTLSSLVRQHSAEAAGRAVLPAMRHPKDQQKDLEFLLDTTGRLWLAGARVDWAAFHGGERRRRIPLPTYPFERRRYWLEPGVGGSAPNAPRGASEKKSDMADWFYVPSWSRVPPAADGRVAGTDCVLVFTDELGLGTVVAARLRAAGRRVVEVQAGAAFGAITDDVYQVRPGERADYGALLERLADDGRAPWAIVHLWSVTAHRPPGGLDLEDPEDGGSLQRSQDRGFYSLLFLAQALGEKAADRPVQIEVVSNDLFDVTGGEAMGAERATVLGPSMVIPLEYERITCRHVDVSLPESLNGGAAADAVVDQLVVEWATPPQDDVVAYRGRHRWVRGPAAMRLPPVESDAPWKRRGGVYLITGGLGGIGLVLAESLAEQLDAKLVLIGRSGLPERGQWDAWIEQHGEEDRTSRRIRAVRRLEDRGTEVMVASADVADLARMREVLALARERFGAIHGVIHSAGLSTGGVIALRTKAAAAEVLGPKVAGTLVLRHLLRAEPLDFFAVCSSLNGLLGAVGAADYCGANAFLDALAACGDGGPPLVSVSWDAWSEVGMAAETEVSGALRREREEQLAKGILSVEGAEALARVLSSGMPHVYVSASDLLARIAAAALSEAAPVADVAESRPVPASAPTAATHERPNLANSYVEPSTELERAIAEVAQELLGIDRVGVHDNFFDLGFDSLLGQRLVARLKQRHQIALPIHTILESPTAAQLAEYAEAAQWIAQSRVQKPE